jgi:hypothetical protein
MIQNCNADPPKIEGISLTMRYTGDIIAIAADITVSNYEFFSYVGADTL